MALVRRHRWIHLKPLSAPVIRLNDYQYAIYSGMLAGAGSAMGKITDWLAGGDFAVAKSDSLASSLGFLVTLALCATLGWLFSPETLASPQIHLLSGATMLGAFFILTDPVTASTTNRGRVLFRRAGGLISLVDPQFRRLS